MNVIYELFENNSLKNELKLNEYNKCKLCDNEYNEMH